MFVPLPGAGVTASTPLERGVGGAAAHPPAETSMVSSALEPCTRRRSSPASPLMLSGRQPAATRRCPHRRRARSCRRRRCRAGVVAGTAAQYLVAAAAGDGVVVVAAVQREPDQRADAPIAVSVSLPPKPKTVEPVVVRRCRSRSWRRAADHDRVPGGGGLELVAAVRCPGRRRVARAVRQPEVGVDAREPRAGEVADVDEVPPPPASSAEYLDRRPCRRAPTSVSRETRATSRRLAR